jgi:hypothetical protein
MSTNIIVDVALAALRQLNQAQVNANRQVKLLADRNAKLAQKAVDDDVKAKAQESQGPDGLLLYGVKSERQKPQEQPIAAFRSDEALNLGHGYFTLTSGGTGTTRTGTVRVATSGSSETDNLNESTATFTFTYPTIGSLPSFTSTKVVYDGLTDTTTTTYNEAGDPSWGTEVYIAVNTEDPASVAAAEAQLLDTYDFTITNYSYSTLSTQERRKRLVLPAGRNTFIAVALCENAWARRIDATTDTEHRELSYRETIPGFYIADVITTSETTYDVYSAVNDTDRQAYAFVVGLDATRQISVPAGLSDDLDRLWPPFTLSYNNLGAPFYGTPADHPGNEAGTVSHYLLRSFGLGALNTTAHQFACLTGTPSVFDYLATFPGGITLADSRSYSAMSSYLSSLPSRYVAPIYSFGSGVASYLTTMPVATNAAVASGFRLYRSITPGTINSSLSNRALSWDWGQASYCRTKLLELGFTSADLTP